MENTLIVISNDHNPYSNHAIEEILLTEFKDYSRIFFMWINSPAVVFGRNQNPWKEIHIKKAQNENVALIRRLSGGGTVYHDLGNLNFSFIETQKRYDEDLHFEIICNAISEFGIQLEKNERKDLLLEGKKISGNAFYLKGNRRLHHGTLLVHTDAESIWKVLKKKASHIESRGISSVTSTVTSLRSVVSNFQVEMAMNSIVTAFYKLHRYEVATMSTDRIQYEFQDRHKAIIERLKSWEWTYGETPPFIYRLDDENYLKISNGLIQEIIGPTANHNKLLQVTSKFNDQFKED